MTRKLIKELAQKSFFRNNLDAKRVKYFVSKMKRKEIRGYLRTIKTIDSRNTVRIIFPSLTKIKKSDILRLSNFYKGRKIIVGEDPSLILGVRLIDNDLVYDFNLENSFENIIEKYD